MDTVAGFVFGVRSSHVMTRNYAVVDVITRDHTIYTTVRSVIPGTKCNNKVVF
jgi:hypothetical protein